MEALLKFIPYFLIYLLLAGSYYYFEKYRLNKRTDPFPSYVIVMMFVFAVVTRLFLAGYEYGAWDVENFAVQADVAYSGGNIYEWRGGATHTYPPFNILFLLFWKQVSVWTSLPFAFLYKLTYIFIDIVFILLALRLSSKTRIHQENMALLIATSPLIILVPTVIGQIDIMPTFFAFLAFVLLKDNPQRWRWSALSLGLAICAKTFPIILLPAFLCELSSKKRMVGFIFLAILPAIMLMSVAALICPTPKAVFTNVISFKGWVSGAWGFGGLFWMLTSFFEHVVNIPVAKQLMGTLWEWHKDHGRWLFFLHMGIGIVFIFRRTSFLQRIIYTYLGFYVFTNYCGPAHLIWILPFLFYGEFLFSAGFHFWTNLSVGVYAPFATTGRLHLEKISKVYPFFAGCLWVCACYSLVRLLLDAFSNKSSEIANNRSADSKYK